jgi:hypothetical protein
MSGTESRIVSKDPASNRFMYHRENSTSVKGTMLPLIAEMILSIESQVALAHERVAPTLTPPPTETTVVRCAWSGS